jgi:hypothetical protein
MGGRSELPPHAGVAYSAFCDPSGGVNDAMTLAIGHLHRGDVCVLDVVKEERPPFDPERAVAKFAACLREYGISTVVGDKYAGEWPRARFAEHGIEFSQSSRPKSELYGDLLPLLNARRVELLDIPRLSAQLCGLERRTARSGKDSIDHVPGGHDDVANAAAGVLVQLDLDRRPSLVSLADVAPGEREPEWPRYCEYAYAMICDAGADIAVVYGGSIRGAGEKLHILDVDVVYFRPGLFRDMVARLKDLAVKCHAQAAAIFALEHLVGQVVGLGVAIEPLVDFDAERNLIFAADCIGKGLVRFCPPVIAKMQTRTIGAALALKAGDPVETALRAALIAAVYVKYCPI